MPGQSCPENRFEVGNPSAPAEKLCRKARIGDQHRRVTGPPRGITPGNRPPADRLGNPHHLSHGMTAAGTEVQRRAFPPVREMLEANK